jgi:ribosomal protein L11 methyltransferase
MKLSEPQYKTRIELLVKKGIEELIPEDLYLLSRTGVWTEEKGESVLMRFYPDDREAFLRAVENLHIPIEAVHAEEEELKDYSEMTRRYFRPIKIEDLTIVPPWSKSRPKNPSIIIEPGMAFGTGRHESTRLMIRIMRSVDFNGKTVLDLGCGSAILSLYAHFLGARKVVGVDIDLDSVLNARKNVTLNNADNIDIVCADLGDVGGAYDVILANIDIRTFTSHAGKVMSLTKPDGLVVVSGILGRDRKQLLSLFAPHPLIRMEQKNSWRGFLFQVGHNR